MAKKLTANDLRVIERLHRNQLAKTLMDFVLQHGVPMNEHFENSHGIVPEEDEEILAVLDLSENGCAYALQRWVNLDDDTSYLDGFEFTAIWSLYVTHNKTDHTRRLMYYGFFNDGTEWDDSAEPEHGFVDDLGLADLRYIYEAVCDYYESEEVCENRLDRNGVMVDIGDLVRWYDPDEEARDLTNLWHVDDINGEIIDISCGYSQAEVYACELEIVNDEELKS